MLLKSMIQTLPKDMIAEILRNCQLQDILRFLCTCKAFYDDDALWLILFERCFDAKMKSQNEIEQQEKLREEKEAVKERINSEERMNSEKEAATNWWMRLWQMWFSPSEDSKKKEEIEQKEETEQETKKQDAKEQKQKSSPIYRTLFLDETKALKKFAGHEDTNLYPWFIVNKVHARFGEKVWNHPLFRQHFKSYLHKHFGKGFKHNVFLGTLDGRRKDVPFYDLDLCPRNYWGFDKAPQSQIRFTSTHARRCYFECLSQVILETYGGNDLPSRLSVWNRLESHPPRAFVQEFIEDGLMATRQRLFADAIPDMVVVTTTLEPEQMKPGVFYIENRTSNF